MASLELGVMSSPKPEGENPFQVIADYGVETTQFANWNPKLWTLAYAAEIKRCAKAAGVKLAAVWAGYSGPAEWNLTKGPVTLGLVPTEFRRMRVAELKKAAVFAAACGAPAIVTHCGFIPEFPGDPLYKPTVRAIKSVAQKCLDVGIGFWFETGQETPVTLLRTIQDIGLPNLGINLDTANLVLYGKANPLDALDVFGKHVRCLHAKDGMYPTDGRSLGAETAIGKGKVDFPKVIARLLELKFKGRVVIEREIHGDQQSKDIKASLVYLRRVIARAEAKRRA